LGFGASYKFQPNLIGHFSADVMWIGDLASAPAELVWQANPAPTIDTGTTLFLSGVSFGLEYNW
jgi:hypothetical protein